MSMLLEMLIFQYFCSSSSRFTKSFLWLPSPLWFGLRAIAKKKSRRIINWNNSGENRDANKKLQDINNSIVGRFCLFFPISHFLNKCIFKSSSNKGFSGTAVGILIRNIFSDLLFYSLSLFLSVLSFHQ